MAQGSVHADQATMKNLIEECHGAAQAASACATHCIEQHGKEMAECIRNNLDAATVGQATALLAARGSSFVKPLAQTAADVFQKCAKVCRAEADGSDVMTRCADACEQAMETCREIGSVR